MTNSSIGQQETSALVKSSLPTLHTASKQSNLIKYPRNQSHPIPFLTLKYNPPQHFLAHFLCETIVYTTYYATLLLLIYSFPGAVAQRQQWMARQSVSHQSFSSFATHCGVHQQQHINRYSSNHIACNNPQQDPFSMYYYKLNDGRQSSEPPRLSNLHFIYITYPRTTTTTLLFHSPVYLSVYVCCSCL